ncbi:four-carbon acid sugar kinase family protein [Neolewinella persica]|uniref:four-carbon acid sugar kinase family protein n=1 Tax=Neolewinella persica TaxID=70998 RepID=UPI0003769B6C|nr:four-carbon acid sugar kinase family protein [Neolewinella persica]
MDLPVLDFAKTMASLPAQQPKAGLDEAIRQALFSRYNVVIVLDDDPTGTQTVYDVPVITELTEVAIVAEIERQTPLFYVLTNSRALPGQDANGTAYSVGEKIGQTCKEAGKRPLVIIRGDSTLRGHFPNEDEWLTTGLQLRDARYFFIPAFFEGGRYTINDVHYVREGGKLVPAGQTPFAKDGSFGYRASNLTSWIEEKTEGIVQKEEVTSLNISELRAPAPLALKRKLESIAPGAHCIINATDYTDLKRAALAILRFAEHPQFRTSASFIKALLGQPDRPLLKIKAKEGRGGLIIVGSHVPKTTAQLKHLLVHNQLSEYEVDVPALLSNGPPLAPRDLAQKISEAYTEGKTCVIYTSRDVITTKGAVANLNIAATVSGYLEAVVAALPEAPSYLLTKGGITSSRIATEALGVKRAMVLGQVQPGVPTWELGPESKFPGMPFIIFPGNVGGEGSLSLILQNTII